MRVVGLGNPGHVYADTRHNVGFRVVERLAQRWDARFQPPERGCRCAPARFEDNAVTLVEPLLYMNRSGEALAGITVESEGEMIVVHDDLDLTCGRVAVKSGGGTGGHRGLESLVEHFGPELVRVRVGIGRPLATEDVSRYVLSPFEPAEAELAAAAIERAGDAVETILSRGVAVAMNTFNRRPLERPRKEEE